MESGATYLKSEKKQNCQHGMLSKGKISFKDEGEIKNFLDMQNQK